MHLSLLSDATFSDLIDDASRDAPRASASQQHLDGLLRGLVFAAALITPLALTFAPVALEHVARLSAHLEALL